jgi:hypothetical protein
MSNVLVNTKKNQTKKKQTKTPENLNFNILAYIWCKVYRVGSYCV